MEWKKTICHSHESVWMCSIRTCPGSVKEEVEQQGEEMYISWVQ